MGSNRKTKGRGVRRTGLFVLVVESGRQILVNWEAFRHLPFSETRIDRGVTCIESQRPTGNHTFRLSVSHSVNDGYLLRNSIAVVFCGSILFKCSPKFNYPDFHSLSPSLFWPRRNILSFLNLKKTSLLNFTP